MNPPTTLLISHGLEQRRGHEITALATSLGMTLEFIVLPSDPEARLSETDCARIDLAFFSNDIFPKHSRQFFSTVRKAPRLRWLQVFNAGVDHPIYSEMIERGAQLTTAAGTTAVPIAQAAIAGLLMLARNFPRWLTAQREHRWDPVPPHQFPRDLAGQTALVVGFGAIGQEFGRLARALGLRVIGVRRSPLRPEDQVDALYPPQQLDSLLPQADWLVIATPLTAQTRGLINASRLAALPQGARVINVGRGEIIDEPALISQLQSGHLGGAYLDVFATEPLPTDSPLWQLPNVLISPHNSAAAQGNEERVYQLFLKILSALHRGVPLTNLASLSDA